MLLFVEVVDVGGENFPVAVEVILHFAFLVDAVDFKQLSTIANQHWVFLQLLLNGVRLFLLRIHICIGALLLVWEQLSASFDIVADQRRRHVFVGSVICLVEERASLADLPSHERTLGHFGVKIGLRVLSCLCRRSADRSLHSC